MATSRGLTTREALIDATERLMCEGGLAAVTTQNVSRECGLAEGTIYRHFQSREELIVTVLRQRLPGEFQPAVDSLIAGAGRDEIDAGLAKFLAALLPIFSVMSPVAGMLAADPALAARNAEALRADGRCPSHLISQIAAYLTEERRLGRLARDVDVSAAAGMIVGVCFYRSLMQHLFGEDPMGLSDEQLPAAVATILARGVAAPAPPKERAQATRPRASSKPRPAGKR